MVDYQSRDTTLGGDEDTGDESTDHGPRDDEDGADDAGHHPHDDHGHDHHAHDRSELGVGVVTISSSRSLDDDPSGDAIAEILESADHTVVTRELVRDSRDAIQSTVDNLVDRDDVGLVVTTGGTGVSPDDVTVEAVRPLLEKDLPGFGEVFRAESYDDIGTKVVGTRATAGIANGVPVFVLPGSENAVRLATAEIILPEAGHLAGLATRGRDEDEE